MKKVASLLGAVALALPVISHAATTTILFDPDGAGGNAPLTIDVLDFRPGNALALQGGNLTPGLNAPTQLLYQANLGSATLTDPVTQNTIPQFSACQGGANPTACFTVVAGFEEAATVTNGGLTANFTLANPVGGPTGNNFFYIYRVGAGGGNDLSGANFTSGTRVLTAYVSSVSSSNFNVTDPTTPAGTPQDLDQFNGNNYPGQQTVVGSGSTALTATIVSADQNYFPGLALSNLAFSFFNTSTVTPFNQANPSAAFSRDGITSANRPAALAPINGMSGRTGADFQFQADGNQSFAAVPEPGSITLVGLALAGLGFAKRRRA